MKELKLEIKQNIEVQLYPFEVYINDICDDAFETEDDAEQYMNTIKKYYTLGFEAGRKDKEQEDIEVAAGIREMERQLTSSVFAIQDEVGKELVGIICDFMAKENNKSVS